MICREDSRVVNKDGDGGYEKSEGELDSDVPPEKSEGELDDDKEEVWEEKFGVQEKGRYVSL